MERGHRSCGGRADSSRFKSRQNYATERGKKHGASATSVQNEDQSALVTEARTLHDVEVIIDEEHLRRAAGILFVNFDERVDAGLT
jgi:hypothetical protein